MCASGRKSSVEATWPVTSVKRVQQLDHVGRLGVQVRVGEDAALGAAGGAGGVADRRDRVRGEGRAALGDLVVGQLLAQGGEFGHGSSFQLPDARGLGVAGRAGGDRVGVLGGLRDDETGARVPDDPLHLVRRRGRVDRYRLAAGRPDREVEDRPLVAGAGHDRDPAARFEARGCQPLRDGGDFAGEGGRGDGVPGAGPFAAEDHGVGGLRRVGERKVGGTSGRRARGERQRARLPYDAPLVPGEVDPGAGRQVGALPRPLQVLAYAHDGSRSTVTGTSTYSQVGEGQWGLCGSGGFSRFGGPR